MYGICYWKKCRKHVFFPQIYVQEKTELFSYKQWYYNVKTNKYKKWYGNWKYMQGRGIFFWFCQIDIEVWQNIKYYHKEWKKVCCPQLHTINVNYWHHMNEKIAFHNGQIFNPTMFLFCSNLYPYSSCFKFIWSKFIFLHQ